MASIEFCRLHAPALERDEVRHNVMLATLDAIADGKASDVVTWSLGLPGQCAIMAPSKPILLADLEDIPVPHARGRHSADRLSRCGWSRADRTLVRPAAPASRGIRFHEPIPQRIHSLATETHLSAAPPRARAADNRRRCQPGGGLDHGRSDSRATPHDPLPSRERLEVRSGARPLYVLGRRG